MSSSEVVCRMLTWRHVVGAAMVSVVLAGGAASPAFAAGTTVSSTARSNATSPAANVGVYASFDNQSGRILHSPEFSKGSNSRWISEPIAMLFPGAPTRAWAIESAGGFVKTASHSVSYAIDGQTFRVAFSVKNVQLQFSSTSCKFVDSTTGAEVKPSSFRCESSIPKTDSYAYATFKLIRQ